MNITQTKPLRAYGIDVTQMSMQPILDSLGIDKQVKELSQAEKEILRYLATLKQANIAMGDLANTINSPSNQLKVFRQQLVETKVALTSLFIGTFAKILPYANAILMVIKEISKAIANFFGIKLQDYNTGIATNDAYGDSLDSVGDSASNAKKKIKELKREIFSFDEIHNINEDKDNGTTSGTGSGISGGIDQRLLDAIKGYDNGMDKVRMKAIDIRDRIMEWLGFTKKINPLTGETYFTYDGIDKTISNIVKWWKNLNTEGKIWTSLGVALGFVKLYGVLKKISNVTGVTTLFKGLMSLFNKMTPLTKSTTSNVSSLISKVKTLSKTNGGLLNGIRSGTTEWLKQNKVLTKSNGLIAMIVVGWTSFIKQYNNNAKFKNSVNEIFEAISRLKILNTVVTPFINILKKIPGYVKEVGSSLTGLSDSIVNNFVDKISYPFKMINSFFDSGLKGMINTTFDTIGTWGNNLKNTFISIANINPFIHFETEAEKLSKTIKQIENDLFSNGGTSIKEYKQSLDNLLSSIVDGVPNVSKYNDIIKDSEARYNGANDSLKILLTQMQTDAYKITADDISNLNTILDSMVDSIKASGQASTDATTVIVNNLAEQGKMTREQADEAISYAITLAEIQENEAEKYRLKMLELNNQYQKGIISKEQLVKKQAELNEQFGLTSKTVDTAKNSIKNYANYINGEKLISTKNFSELNEAIKGIGKTFDDNSKKIKDNYNSQRELNEKQQYDWQRLIDKQNEKLENLKKAGKEETQEYQNAMKELEKYQQGYESVSNTIIKINSQQKDDIVSLKQITVDALLGIVANLKESNYSMEKDSEGTVATLNEIFKSIGVEVDLSKNMNEITRIINSKLGTNISQTVKSSNKALLGIGVGVNPTVKVKADTSQAKKIVDDFLKKLNSTKVAVSVGGVLGAGFKANGGIYSNGSWKNIPQYANGGAPSHGSMFIAGERGAEIVGHINGKTEVLNQSQIASAIYNAVVSAMSQYSGGGVAEINVRADEGIIVETAINGINQKTRQTGVCPVDIPIN